MQRLIPVLMAACLALAGCQTGTTATDEPVANAITGGEIEVTALDDAAPAATASEAVAAEAVPDAAEPAEAVTPDPVASEAAPVAEPEALKSEAQLACDKKGGRWTQLGTSNTHTCVRVTKDSGKSCTKESQCESRCLARSGTCAPFDPLLGCNEILQDNGARVTLCIE
ncbi:hypothetical protein [Tabrizicola sp. BL-A-41-H6]|uniref:hypothetical protein n=1 Tax=Tabrizicola sp. BL-A-41-H6 TaxID=3421107 RepID=UPI003D665A1F